MRGYCVPQPSGAAGDVAIVIGGETLICDVHLRETPVRFGCLEVPGESEPLPVEAIDAFSLVARGIGIRTYGRFERFVD